MKIERGCEKDAIEVAGPRMKRTGFYFLSLLRARSKFVRSLWAVIEDHHEGRESWMNVLDGEARARRTEWYRTSVATGSH